MTIFIIQGSLAEWSNAIDSKSILLGGGGSNPPAVGYLFGHYFYESNVGSLIIWTRKFSNGSLMIAPFIVTEEFCVL
jgi:hypothetical protein